MTRTIGESWELPHSPQVRKIGRDQFRGTRYFMVYQSAPDVAYDVAEPKLPVEGEPFPPNLYSGRGISSRIDLTKLRTFQMRYYDVIGTEGNEHSIIAVHYETGPDWSLMSGKRRVLWEVAGASESYTLHYQPLGANIGTRLDEPLTLTRPIVSIRGTCEGPSNSVAGNALRNIGKVNHDSFIGKPAESLLLDAVDTQLIAGSDSTSGGRGTIVRTMVTFLWRPTAFGWRETEPLIDDDGNQRNNGEDVLYYRDFPVRETFDFGTIFTGWITGDYAADNPGEP